MVDHSNTPKPKPQKRRRKRIPPPEELWVKEFVQFTGTENVTAVCPDDLHGVGLTRVVEALRLGSMTWSSKCDGSGTVCTFEHVASDDDIVQVAVWFESNVAKLEIREARSICEENDSEPNAA